jgi:hypothetical protein
MVFFFMYNMSIIRLSMEYAFAINLFKNTNVDTIFYIFVKLKKYLSSYVASRCNYPHSLIRPAATERKVVDEARMRSCGPRGCRPSRPTRGKLFSDPATLIGATLQPPRAR